MCACFTWGILAPVIGEVAEWFKAAVLKTVDPRGSGVRIPPSPPFSQAVGLTPAWENGCQVGMRTRRVRILLLLTGMYECRESMDARSDLLSAIFYISWYI